LSHFVDNFVLLERDYLSSIKLREWPQLVGIKGEDAVEIIKKETGRIFG
jgi:hypothetical protein